MTIRQVTVQLHRESDGSWWADTPDLPGYTAADPELDGLRQLLLEGLAEFLGEPVVLKEVVPGGYDFMHQLSSTPNQVTAAKVEERSWRAIPVHWVKQPVAAG